MAESYRPSNGTEGDIFISHWCDRCTRVKDWEVCDLPKHEQPDPSTVCDIVTRTFWTPEDDPAYPKEWQICGMCGAVCKAWIDKDAPPPTNPKQLAIL